MPLKRIIMHWSAGAHSANSSDRKHYHEIVEGDGSRVKGDLLPEANNSTADGNYAAHTRRLNTGSIGLSMASMAGAKEKPFDAGKFPITKVQLKAFVTMVAEYADTYDIAITRETVLTHAEVEPTLGVTQSGKWDITWLPGMKKPGAAIATGDRLRKMISDVRKSAFGTATVSGTGSGSSTIDKEKVDELAAHIMKFFADR